MEDLRTLIQNIAHKFDREDNSAFDLWTNLPSYKEAQKYHGDYAANFTPPINCLLIEATLFIQHKLNPTPEEVEEAGDFYHCPCGEFEWLDENMNKIKEK